MRTTKEELVDLIVNRGENPMCLHALGQPLVDLLCEIIRDKEKEIEYITQEQDKTV